MTSPVDTPHIEPTPDAGTSSSWVASIIRPREPAIIFLVSLLVFVLLTPRIIAYLEPLTGDEPFYLMTDISIWKDHDLNECNNYLQTDSAALYPAFYVTSTEGELDVPPGWKGWEEAPYPLSPHIAQIDPRRQCIELDPTKSFYQYGSGTELYSKHGLGLSLLVLAAFVAGGRTLVVYFLNVLAALLAMNVYLLAREGTGRMAPALLTWVAFTFTVPLLPYSFLIFPELPAALFVLYAFRRIRLWDNGVFRSAALGFSMAFLPWLHFRFVPVTVALLAYYLYQAWSRRRKGLIRSYRTVWLVVGEVVGSGILLMAFFYQRYGQITPNPADHAGISDVAGTFRGAAGSFLDQQWGLFISAPVFVLAIVGIILMGRERASRRDLLWLGIIFVPYFGVIANYAQWWGEWCPPARYLTSTLPLLALPFAISLARIKSRAYKGLYGVLLLLSFGMLWGFLFQPQWMYHQPNGRNQVFTYGIPGALKNTPLASEASSISSNLVTMVPSFVRPYFDYANKGRAAGDASSAAAWRKSLWLFLIIVFTVIWSLVLSRRRAEEPSESSPDPPQPPRIEGALREQP